MSQKIIKLSDEHYIGVDDSNMKKGDYCFINNEIHQVENFNVGVLPEHIHKYGDAINTCYNIKIGHYICFPKSLIGKKITHSTQPLELSGSVDPRPIVFNKIKQILTFTFPGFMSSEAQEFFKDVSFREDHPNVEGVSGTFVILSDGKIHLPSKGETFIKDEQGKIKLFR